MEYVSTAMPDSLSVKGIFTVFHPVLSLKGTGNGESHNFPEIIYVIRGEHTIIIDEAEYTLKGGQMIIYAPGAHHRSKAPSEAEASIISFEADSKTLPFLYNKIITLSPSQKKVFSGIIEDGVKSFKKRDPSSQVGGMILKEDAEEYTLQRMKKQLEFFLIDIHKNCLSEALPKSSKSRHWDAEFESAVEFLKRNICSNLSLSEIAEGCSMSVSKLKLLFREKYGGGPINYFIELKIEKAKQLIDEGNLNLTEIAESLGFNALFFTSVQKNDGYLTVKIFPNHKLIKSGQRCQARHLCPFAFLFN